MQKRKYFIILVLGFVGWLAETAYFGFNKTPQSGLEGLLDTATAAMMIYGLVGDLLTNVEIHKNYYKYKETNITTKNVNVNGQNPKIDYNFGTTAKETRDLLANTKKD